MQTQSLTHVFGCELNMRVRVLLGLEYKFYCQNVEQILISSSWFALITPFIFIWACVCNSSVESFISKHVVRCKVVQRDVSTTRYTRWNFMFSSRTQRVVHMFRFDSLVGTNNGNNEANTMRVTAIYRDASRFVLKNMIKLNTFASNHRWQDHLAPACRKCCCAKQVRCMLKSKICVLLESQHSETK